MSLAGLSEQNTFITNVVKYRPPGNRTPTMEEIRAGSGYLREEFFALSMPRVLVAAGATARAALMLQSVLMGAKKMPPWGQPYELDLQAGFWLWPMYHPAFAIRQINMRPTVERHWEELGEWLRLREML
jgi:DNA polymerase